MHWDVQFFQSFHLADEVSESSGSEDTCTEVYQDFIGQPRKHSNDTSWRRNDSSWRTSDAGSSWRSHNNHSSKETSRNNSLNRNHRNDSWVRNEGGKADAPSTSDYSHERRQKERCDKATGKLRDILDVGSGFYFK